MCRDLGENKGGKKKPKQRPKGWRVPACLGDYLLLCFLNLRVKDNIRSYSKGHCWVPAPEEEPG